MSKLYLICEPCNQLYTLPCNPREAFPVARSTECAKCSDQLKPARNINGAIYVLDIDEMDT
jgi:hypothetical protein